MNEMRRAKIIDFPGSKLNMPRELAHWELRESLEKGIIFIGNIDMIFKK